MEHLIRVLNDDDRQTLSWLRAHVGEKRVTDAALHLIARREQTSGTGVKPYVSAICRYLGIWPPTPLRATPPIGDHTLADDHLAQMR